MANPEPIKKSSALRRISVVLIFCLMVAAGLFFSGLIGSRSEVISERDHTALVESGSSGYYVVRFWDGRKVELYADQEFRPGDSMVVVERTFANGDVEYLSSP